VIEVRYDHLVNGDAVVHGNGVTAACCVQALAANSLAVTATGVQQPQRGSVVLLSDSTQVLLAGLFHRSNLFDQVPSIRQRIVAWGDGASSVSLPHSALMIAENDLLARLQQASHTAFCDPKKTAWHVFCTAGLAPPDESQPFGSRTATFSEVHLSDATPRETCWMESVAQGWLFLFAAAGETGWLISCGGPPTTLLGESRLIAKHVVALAASSAPIATSPRIRDCLGATAWMACGTAALMFDPICGEGTGNAVREAILASAVVEAAMRGEDVSALLQHYESRLTLGFLRHLHMCAQFYATGGASPFWQEQVHETQRGIAMISQRIQNQRPPAFRLRDLKLERIAMPSLL
jgi:hypothetical protein